MPVKTIQWKEGSVYIIDQTLLPEQYKIIKINSISEMAEAIRTMRIRGAPAIGIAAAFGVYLGARSDPKSSGEDFLKSVHKAVHLLKNTRPTAVNLFWALDRMKQKALSAAGLESDERIAGLLQEARDILEEDRRMCRLIGKNGLSLITGNEVTFLTHCNAGALATADYGTALGIIYAAREAGRRVRVFSDETRPLLQGSRLTAWELTQAGIEVTVICDNAAAFLMKQGKIDYIIVGADRIAKNGDVANKIGTYNLAVLAEKHKIPFIVAAPTTTFDFKIDSGAQIPIEERGRNEVIRRFGILTAPENAAVYNPAFDVTDHNLVSAIVTEKGVLSPPFREAIKKLENKS
ncbi:methylthioribose-1-phosphate isomerase [bacterium BMS3Abin05]|nr:methylthioribose-1-phosphate isomerase [bacterium BMS3Abin05]GBE28817.1 methylthioribose-1-phosphate isomerase [bacterium BMS3Bbin03]HDK36529.1 S-methyl-5-thioribose-1-phosphate isomerase [Bacteroidota bacterium]HDL78364.1 S-methyl-5-thioribose-1-phosphate isomerase [Bacteroidota bacterium]HDZ12938.1 S-methyl-5-thioribose-1-phosphate isomerase [Bacteroidota bacterium]